jgi:hypothetical protein
MITKSIIINSILWQLGTLIAGSALTGLLLAVGHWFPWVRRLPRLKAYEYGTASILAGFALWRLLNLDPVAVLGFGVIATVGGAVVHLAYYVDDVVLAVRKAHKAEIIDQEIGRYKELD